MHNDEKLDLSVAALVALAENGVPADIQELLVRGNPALGVKAGAINDVIKAVIKTTQQQRDWELEDVRQQNAALKASLAAHEADTETLLGFVSAEDDSGSDPDHHWSESVFISDRKTDQYEFPVYRAPVTRNRILEGVQEICATIIKGDPASDADRAIWRADTWRADTAREISEKIDSLKNHEFFPFERVEVHLIEREDDAFLAVRNLLMPAFTALHVIARRPKLMTNDEWRPVAQTIIDALRRKGPVNYPATTAKKDN